MINYFDEDSHRKDTTGGCCPVCLTLEHAWGSSGGLTGRQALTQCIYSGGL